MSNNGRQLLARGSCDDVERTSCDLLVLHILVESGLHGGVALSDINLIAQSSPLQAQPLHSLRQADDALRLEVGELVTDLMTRTTGYAVAPRSTQGQGRFCKGGTRQTAHSRCIQDDWIFNYSSYSQECLSSM